MVECKSPWKAIVAFSGEHEYGGIKAVQTLLRLNRAHPQKHDTFVLDSSVVFHN